MEKPKLTQERVRELFEYREDGQLIWRVSRGNGVRVGAVAGTLDSHGYLQVGVDGRYYRLHRIVWLYHYGYFPETGLDHIDQVKLHNRIENLREVSHTCNTRNTGNPRDNTSGVKGATWDRARGSWHAQITVAKRNYNLGRFDCLVEAAAHRLAAEQALNWEGCNSCSPAFQYMQKYLRREYDAAAPIP